MIALILICLICFALGALTGAAVILKKIESLINE